MHDDEPCFARRRRCQPEGSVLEVEVELGLVLPGIWHLPILEGDSNIVKEPVVGPGQRPERKANDANVVEEEEGVVFVRHVSCVRSRPATPIIQGVKAVEHF